MNGEGRLSGRPFSFVELLASAMMHIPDNVGHKTNPLELIYLSYNHAVSVIVSKLAEDGESAIAV